MAQNIYNICYLESQDKLKNFEGMKNACSTLINND